jgi:hypothetical protein
MFSVLWRTQVMGGSHCKNSSHLMIYFAAFWVGAHSGYGTTLNHAKRKEIHYEAKMGFYSGRTVGCDCYHRVIGGNIDARTAAD